MNHEFRGQMIYDDIIRYINRLSLDDSEKEGLIQRLDRFVDYNWERLQYE